MRLLHSSLASVALITLTTFAASCGDDGNDGGDVDASPAIDAPAIDAPAPIDAPPAVYTGLGQSCTGPGQGDCPNGFECLNLQNASGTWCSQQCVDQADPVCATDYNGPGMPACLLSVDLDNDGNPDFNSCLVLCDDGPGAGDGCPGCDGTCPGTMICDQDILDGNGEVVALACR